MKFLFYSQHIGDDTDRPHVRRKSYGLEIHDLGRHELWRAKQHLKLCGRVVLARQAEVNDLDSISVLGQTQNVFGLIAGKQGCKSNQA